MCGCFAVATAWLYWTSLAPGTLTYSQERWSNKSWGFFNIDREVQTGTVTVGRDGSRVTKLDIRMYRLYFVPKESLSYTTIYRASDSTAYIIDHQTREIHRDPCVEYDFINFRAPHLPCQPIRTHEVAVDPLCSEAARWHSAGTFVGIGNVAG